MKKSKATITISPVAWSGEKVLKFQACGECSGRRIWGDPRATQKGALSALAQACESFATAAGNINAELNSDKYQKIINNAEDPI